MISEVELKAFDTIADKRGKLVVLEPQMAVPFDIKRVYYLYGTASGAERGFHAHINLKQLAVCVSGSCTIEVECARERKTYLLDSPDKGLYMGGIVWREMRNFTDDCVLMVLADELYSENDYIRSYEDYKECLQKVKKTTGKPV